MKMWPFMPAPSFPFTRLLIHARAISPYAGRIPQVDPRNLYSMNALVKRKAEPGLWLEDVPEPEIGINDVLIQVDRTGICGTDLHIYKWDDWAKKTIPVPMVVGHEFVGEIVAIGSNLPHFHP